MDGVTPRVITMKTANKIKKKRTKLPAKYEPGFLGELDQRSLVYRELKNAYDEIVSDAGGEDDLTHTQLSLIERFVFLEAVLRTWENAIAVNPKANDHLVGKWTQGVNALQGLAKVIGLKRHMKKTASLKSYLKERA